MQSLDFHTVNVFTNTAFTSNPLAIVMQADTLSDRQMKTLARGLRQGYDMGRPSDLLLNIELIDSELIKVKVARSSTPISSGTIRVPTA